MGVRRVPPHAAADRFRGGTHRLLPFDAQPLADGVGLSVRRPQAVHLRRAGRISVLRHVLVPAGSEQGEKTHSGLPGPERHSAH